MTISDFFENLKQVRIPWRYDHVEEGLPLPFGVYTYERAPMLEADNKVFAIKNKATVDVYAKTKEELDEICLQIEKVFEDNDIIWSSNESHSMDEVFYLNSYSMEV